jgi:hypothetical protein
MLEKPKLLLTGKAMARLWHESWKDYLSEFDSMGNIKARPSDAPRKASNRSSKDCYLTD